MNIGLIGAGAIANFLLQQISKRNETNFRITSVYVRDQGKYTALTEKFGITLYTELDAFLTSNIDIVVEAATIEAVGELVPAVIVQKPVVLISVGALADEQLLQRLVEIAEEHNHPIYLPSGAIGGLDLLQNADVLGTVTSVTLTTRKPASSLVDEEMTEEKIVFEGTAREAIRKFPKNMNVAIVLALSNSGSDENKVRLVADPHITQNIHQIDIVGEFGEATFVIKNNALPQNPKTSYLAVMSILGTLKRIQRKLIIGG